MTAKYEHDDLAKIAYRAWLERGQPDGSPEIDWYYAVSVVTNPEEISPSRVDGFNSQQAQEHQPTREPDSPSSSPDSAHEDMQDNEVTRVDSGAAMSGARKKPVSADSSKRKGNSH